MQNSPFQMCADVQTLFSHIFPVVHMALHPKYALEYRNIMHHITYTRYYKIVNKSKNDQVKVDYMIELDLHVLSIELLSRYEPSGLSSTPVTVSE